MNNFNLKIIKFNLQNEFNSYKFTFCAIQQTIFYPSWLFKRSQRQSYLYTSLFALNMENMENFFLFFSFHFNFFFLISSLAFVKYVALIGLLFCIVQIALYIKWINYMLHNLKIIFSMRKILDCWLCIYQIGDHAEMEVVNLHSPNSVLQQCIGFQSILKGSWSISSVNFFLYFLQIWIRWRSIWWIKY